jgi:hypothetical protein
MSATLMCFTGWRRGCRDVIVPQLAFSRRRHGPYLSIDLEPKLKCRTPSKLQVHRWCWAMAQLFYSRTCIAPQEALIKLLYQTYLAKMPTRHKARTFIHNRMTTNSTIWAIRAWEAPNKIINSIKHTYMKLQLPQEPSHPTMHKTGINIINWAPDRRGWIEVAKGFT